MRSTMEALDGLQLGLYDRTRSSSLRNRGSSRPGSKLTLEEPDPDRPGEQIQARPRTFETGKEASQAGPEAS